MGTRLIVALTVLLTLLLPAAPGLQAQGNGPRPAKPTGPNHGETEKVGVAASLSGPVRVMIELTDAPAVVAAAQGVGPRPGQVSSSTFAAQAARVDQAQRSMLQALQSSGIHTQVIYRVQKAYNGIATLVDAGDVDRIKTQPGVKSVRLLRPMKISNNSTVPLINAPTAWTTPGLTGQGIKIGIIDTGIDYVHRNFGGGGIYTTNTSVTMIGDSPDFPSLVVVGGYDFAGDAYDADSSNPAIFTPNPDPDPMDCNGHGSHVAGSAAGRGVTSGGATFAGTYDGSVPFGSLKIGPGVAPAATLYALKVFGCTGSTELVTQAIDWALDPNDDNDLSDHLDVVNMSLGSDFGFPDDPEEVAVNNATLSGMVIVASAGNSGDTTAVSGSPASATRAISVAASDDSTARLDGFKVTGSLVGTYPGSASANFSWSGTLVTAPAQYAGAAVSGCSALGAGFAGKIALIEWIPTGSTASPCGSTTRTNNAQNAGAVGVLLLYNQPSLDITIAGNGIIPAMISDSTTASTLKASLTGLNVTFDSTLLRTQAVVDATQVDKVASFTSRGPSTRTGGLKPDISAPGVTVFSTARGTGTEGESLSGTSMAAPHVSGLMAVLKQQHPSWTVEELKALAMNTASHDVFSGASHSVPKIEASRIGAGRIDAATATTSSLVAYETDEPGRVSVSFGAVESLGATSLTRTVRVANKGGSPVNVTVSYSPISDVTGASISFPDGTSFSVPPGGSQTFRVRLSMDGSALTNPRDPSMAAAQVSNSRQFLAEVTGLVVVAPTSGPSLRVPLYAAVRPASSMHAGQSTLTTTGATQTLSLGLTGTGLNNGSGTPVGVRSVVSAFELQALSPPMPSSATPEQKAADLRYVGVSSDARALGTVTGSTVYFGLATELNWLRPTEEVIFSVLVDTNRDGTFDFELYNTELVDGGGDPTDVMVTATYNIAGNSTTASSFLNVFDSTLPTAIFRNNVLILSAPVSDLGGLTDSNSRFNYKVNVYYAGVIRDSTATLTYDLLRPGADVFTTPGQTPIFFDMPAGGLTFTYNQANYQANGSLGLLLLHHYNQDGQRAEAIAFAQSQTVSFGPGSPTMKTLGDPPFTVTATSSSGLPVTISSQTPPICLMSGSNVVTLISTGTCMLEASQAGNVTVQPASAVLSIAVAPAPTACSPRPPVVVTMARTDANVYEVAVTAGKDTIQAIRFATDTRPLQNGVVQIDGGRGVQQVTAPTTVTLSPSVASKTFVVTRVTAGQAMTIPFIITDGCGPWETFVGVGAGS